jgi:hypothetical protein
MLSANETKILTIDGQNYHVKVSKHIEKIEGEIKAAASKGKNEIWHAFSEGDYSDVKEGVEKELLIADYMIYKPDLTITNNKSWRIVWRIS